ncbi:uncharacterized protein LAESUDRAFT_176822 [Laetiporus sulphureus 93-53]|uniref:Uncharacterized protein n=1 Tax=Laetiporus sulphureus 93-53 TaxID=1314785 RepID=A0A165E7Y4_9APHY|nr:uncharacterized protein LAESUDRAFT_176822 [Laetiporus sulphureus 93-53]KZT06416.1 hypothetical protein LAESUDRAFT_176822 [Laetiporus sulphureus 93-53]
MFGRPVESRALYYTMFLLGFVGLRLVAVTFVVHVVAGREIGRSECGRMSSLVLHPQGILESAVPGFVKRAAVYGSFQRRLRALTTCVPRDRVHVLTLETALHRKRKYCTASKEVFYQLHHCPKNAAACLVGCSKEK